MAIRWLSGRRRDEAPAASPARAPDPPAAAPGPGSDLALVRSARDGDLSAFNELVVRYQDAVFNVAYRLIGEREQAEEAAQEAFLKAYQGLASFKENASFYTWLFRIAINTAYSKGRTIRRQQRERPFGLPEDDGDERPPAGPEAVPAETAGPVDVALEDERAAAVQEAIRSLDPEFRSVVVLRDIEGRSYEEIASILDCPEGTIRSRLHRARLELRNRLRRLMEPE